MSANDASVVATDAHGGKALPPGRYGFWGLVQSEWTKMRSVRSTVWTLGLLVVVGVGLGALATSETSSHWSTMSFASQATFDPTQTSLIGIFFGQLIIGILGVLVVSAEYGTGTIRATFAAAPRRPLVLGAKVAVFAVIALVVAEVVAFISFLLGQALLVAPAPHTTFSSPGALRAVVESGLYLCVLGCFALGIASIIRHTAGAISTFVGLLLVLPLIIAALPTSIGDDVRRFLPANMGDTIVSRFPGSHSFTPWVALAVLGGYAVVTLGIGTILLVRRDA